MLKIAFYVNPQGIVEKLVGAVAGIPTHVEIVFPHGEWFSSSARDGGCRFKRIVPKPGNWIIFGLEGVKLAPVMAFCLSQDGKPYDWPGALLGWAGGQDRGRWFCSEVCAEALNAGGLFLPLPSSFYTPLTLMRAIMERRPNAMPT